MGKPIGLCRSFILLVLFVCLRSPLDKPAHTRASRSTTANIRVDPQRIPGKGITALTTI